MAKFYGKVGYAESHEGTGDEEGIWTDEIIERMKKKQQEAQQTQLLQQRLQLLQKKEETENGDRKNVNGEGNEQGE